MNLNPEFIPVFWQLAGLFVYAWILLYAVRSAEWWRLKNGKDFNVFLNATVGVMLIWIFKAGLTTTLSLHLLGATLLTLMFGWAFAIIGLSAVFMVLAVYYGYNWLLMPLNMLFVVVLPVISSYLLYRLVHERLPNNFFIYIFLSAFFGAALSIAVVIFSTTIIHLLSGAYSLEYLGYNYYRYALLLMFPEAFQTGMLMSIFVVYRPQWVCTFDDRLYLNNQ